MRGDKLANATLVRLDERAQARVALLAGLTNTLGESRDVAVREALAEVVPLVDALEPSVGGGTSVEHERGGGMFGVDGVEGLDLREVADVVARVETRESIAGVSGEVELRPRLVVAAAPEGRVARVEG